MRFNIITDRVWWIHLSRLPFFFLVQKILHGSFGVKSTWYQKSPEINWFREEITIHHPQNLTFSPLSKFYIPSTLNTDYILAFSTGQDSATFRDKWTEVPSLSRDKGTTGQAKNLAKGQDGPDSIYCGTHNWSCVQ